MAARTAKKKPLSTLFWEWRGFWQGDDLSLLPVEIPSTNIAQDAREEQDVYLVIEGVEDNIKCRAGVLEIKYSMQSFGGYHAFLPKKTYSFPLTAEVASSLFPELLPLSAPVESIEALHQLFQQAGKRSALVEVHKKRFKTKERQGKAQIEFCTMTLDGVPYLSACVEGKDYHGIRKLAAAFSCGHALVMGYVDFLKHVAFSPANPISPHHMPTHTSLALLEPVS